MDCLFGFETLVKMTWQQTVRYSRLFNIIFSLDNENHSRQLLASQTDDSNRARVNELVLSQYVGMKE